MVFPWEPNKADTTGYKRVSHAFEGIYVWEKKEMMFVPHGIERFPVRPWIVWN